MYIGIVDDTPATQRQNPLPYRESLEETERKQLQEYQRDCANVNVLETLERQSRTPLDQVHWLERKLAALPRIIQGHNLVQEILRRRRDGRMTDAQVQGALVGVVHAFPEVQEFPFPPGYAVRSVQEEAAIVRCQLSRARWEFLVWNRTGRVPGRLIPGTRK